MFSLSPSITPVNVNLVWESPWHIISTCWELSCQSWCARESQLQEQPRAGPLVLQVCWELTCDCSPHLVQLCFWVCLPSSERSETREHPRGRTEVNSQAQVPLHRTPVTGLREDRRAHGLPTAVFQGQDLYGLGCVVCVKV